MLGLRIDPALDRLLAAAARARGTTKSALARDAIRRYLGEAALVERAREQSLRASRRGPFDLEVDHDDREWTS